VRADRAAPADMDSQIVSRKENGGMKKAMRMWIGLACAVVLLLCVCAVCPATTTGDQPDAANARPAAGAPAGWSPYLAGALMGVLSWVTFLTAGKALGASTSFVTAAGMIGKQCCPKCVEENEYLQKHPPAADWQFMLVIGIFIGALASALIYGDFTFAFIPEFWRYRFGLWPWSRWATAFFGGVIIMFGARWAGGCTSGHGISGSLQLSLSGWIAAACFFAGGIATANLLYG